MKASQDIYFRKTVVTKLGTLVYKMYYNSICLHSPIFIKMQMKSEILSISKLTGMGSPLLYKLLAIASEKGKKIRDTCIPTENINCIQYM